MSKVFQGFIDLYNINVKNSEWENVVFGNLHIIWSVQDLIMAFKNGNFKSIYLPNT